MNVETSPHDDLEGRIQIVLEFEAFFRRWLRDTRSPVASELNEAERGLIDLLASGPAPLDWLSWQLDTDGAYLCRTLKVMKLRRQVTKCVSPRDRRQRLFSLSDWGRHIAREQQRVREDRARRILEKLPRHHQRDLVQAMGVMQEILKRDPFDVS
jgi:DNA-binding MarR family transcriptional regulator